MPNEGERVADFERFLREVQTNPDCDGSVFGAGGFLDQQTRPFHAMRHLWPKLFPEIPFTGVAVMDWLATKGITRLQSRRMAPAKVERMLADELEAKGAQVAKVADRGQAGADAMPQGAVRGGGQAGGAVDNKPPVSDAPKATYPTPENYERDKWIYEQREAKRTIADIRSDLETNTHGWEPLYSDNGIREAVARYAKHSGLPRPKGRPGKPRGR